MIDRILSAFVAVSLALLIWLYARSRDQEVLDHVPIPVEVTLGSGQGEQYSLEVVNPAEVQASFTGPPARIRELRALLQRDRLRVELSFTVPADRLKENRIYETLLVESSHIHAPSGVSTALVAGRNQVRIVLHRLGEKRLPVRLDASLAARAEARSVEPATVLVRGPLEVLERSSAVVTQPGAVENTQSVVEVSLARELEGRPIECEPCAVRVKLAPAAARKTYELSDVPIHFLTPANFAYRPRLAGDQAGGLALRVTGPAQAERPRVVAYVDLTARPFAGLKAAGPCRFEQTVHVQVPHGFTVEEGPAQSIPFELVPLAP